MNPKLKNNDIFIKIIYKIIIYTILKVCNMAICNIFKQLTNTSGTFLTFSQYLEDMTKHNTLHENYHVVPSKFVCLDIDLNKTQLDLDNESLVLVFQNYFENACAILKGSNSRNYNPNDSKNLFWRSLIDTGIIGTDLTEVKYVGDINIYSYDTVGEMGYSEIYCHIPNEAQCYRHDLTISGDGLTFASGGYIQGYEYSDLGDWGKINNPITYTLYDHEFNWNKSVIACDKFNVNAIVVMYDVINKSNNDVLFREIPMGIYFTGCIIEESNGNKYIGNSITKYISNSTIYGAGTSYGLRICSRYINTETNLKLSRVTVNNEEYSELTQVLAQISRSQNKMDEILDKAYISNQNYKDLLAIFKNSRTNVPYIKNIDGVNYWFVNGKLINKASFDRNQDHVCIDLSAKIDNNVILTTTETGTMKRYIDWEILSGDVKLRPTELSLQSDPSVGFVQQKITSPIELDLSKTNIPTIKEYILKARVNNEVVTETVHVSIVHPSYWGLISSKSVPTSLEGFDVLTMETKSIDVNYTNEIHANNGPRHVCLMYPSVYGVLTSIKDSRDIEYIEDFELKTSTYNGISYNIYIDKTPACVTNYTLKFR